MLPSTLPIHLPPLFWCTIAFILGITNSSLDTSYHLPMSCTLLVGFLITILIAFINKSLRSSLLLLIFASFFIAGFYRYASYVSHYQRTQTYILNRALTGTGIVQECSSSINRFGKHFGICLTLLITSLKNSEFAGQATVQLYVNQKLSLKPADTISFKNLTIKRSMNSTSTWYLVRENILGTVYAQQLHYKLLERPSWSLQRYCATKRLAIATSIKKSLSDRAYTLFATVFLGKKEHTRCYFELRTASSYWGIVHYLARSGLHVVALIGLWASVLRLFGFSFILQQILLILLLGVYYLLSWPSISFNRAVITFLLYQGCLISGHTYQMLHLLTLTTLIILLVNPLHLFFLDFQLSFSLTFALGLYREIAHQQKVMLNENI